MISSWHFPNTIQMIYFRCLCRHHGNQWNNSFSESAKSLKHYIIFRRLVYFYYPLCFCRYSDSTSMYSCQHYDSSLYHCRHSDLTFLSTLWLDIPVDTVSHPCIDTVIHPCIPVDTVIHLCIPVDTVNSLIHPWYPCRVDTVTQHSCIPVYTLAYTCIHVNTVTPPYILAVTLTRDSCRNCVSSLYRHCDLSLYTCRHCDPSPVSLSYRHCEYINSSPLSLSYRHCDSTFLYLLWYILVSMSTLWLLPVSLPTL